MVGARVLVERLKQRRDDLARRVACAALAGSDNWQREHVLGATTARRQFAFAQVGVRFSKKLLRRLQKPRELRRVAVDLSLLGCKAAVEERATLAARWKTCPLPE